MKKVLFTAAHSGFSLDHIPLGGGAAVCEQLVQEWKRTQPFPLEVLGPSILGSAAPQEKDLVAYTELEYARFCIEFERRLTETILPHDPALTVVLSNDISEGPDFKTLAAKGYSLYTIYHVDVVDYFTSIYLKSWVSPQWTTALYRMIRRSRLSPILPRLLKLVWEKQEASVRYSHGLIVPSERMKEVLLRCYPRMDIRRVHVVPWGTWGNPVSAEEVGHEKESLQSQFSISPDAAVLFTLSRISPEKGQDRLIRALALWEKRSDFPKEGLCLLIAGEPAYMMGKKYEKKLRALAAPLKRTQVHFVGYAAGARKKALFELADLYVFPSRHESYGLTLLEALRAGKPVLATPSHGAKDVFRPEFGEMIQEGPEAAAPERLMKSLQRLLADPSGLQAMGARAAAWASRQDFSETASKLAELVASQ